jgi:hypothetical protein
LRLTVPRFRVRTLMIAVGVIALLLASIEPGWKAYRRWSYHRSQAAWCWRLEQAERVRADTEQGLAVNLDAIKATLMQSPDFAAKSEPDRRNMMDREAKFHQNQSDEARISADRWADRRSDEETAAWFCWDPYAPDAP